MSEIKNNTKCLKNKCESYMLAIKEDGSTVYECNATECIYPDEVIGMKNVVNFLKEKGYVFIIVDKYKENIFVSDNIDPINPDIGTGIYEE